MNVAKRSSCLMPPRPKHVASVDSETSGSARRERFTIILKGVAHSFKDYQMYRIQQTNERTKHLSDLFWYETIFTSHLFPHFARIHRFHVKLNMIYLFISVLTIDKLECESAARPALLSYRTRTSKKKKKEKCITS